MKEKISKFKQLALERAFEFMQEDVKYVDVDDFKSMVNVVLMIENSISEEITDIQVNVKDILKKFDDDC